MTGPFNDGTINGKEMSNQYAHQRLTQSTPGSPQEHNRPNSLEVIGSAESLVGRVSCHYYSLLSLFIEHNDN